MFDELTDRAYAAGHLAGWRSGRDAAAEHLRAHLRRLPHDSPTMHKIADEIAALVPPAHVPAPDGSEGMRGAYVENPRPARVEWRCAGCGLRHDRAEDLDHRGACPYPAGVPWHRWLVTITRP